MGEYGQAQSRARGLTRAILDTFPVIKFSRAPAEEQVHEYPKPPDEESGSLEMNELPHGNGPEHAPVPAGERPVAPAINANVRPSVDADVPSSPGAGSSRDPLAASPISPAAVSPESAAAVSPTSQHAAEDHVESPGVLPSAIGRETCPICILDFEDGDDIRVLPCEGHHIFHQACVDPWLLELSSSCPICRHGKYIAIYLHISINQFNY